MAKLKRSFYEREPARLQVELPERRADDGYVRSPMSDQAFVPDRYPAED